MTRLFDDPARFADDSLDGFVAASRRFVRRTDGGVLRAAGTGQGRVAVVIGGGSGHYPAFMGLVGPGLAAAAVCGPIFTSPSAAHVHRVARAAHNGGGVLLSYGNYAGDVLHFDQAQERLNAEGIPTRTVLVTDDIASAPDTQRHLRRGIAGDLTVFKIAGAAADAAHDLAEVERLARLANDRTRSLGVAFAGCTLPGSAEPLFAVPAGGMSLGLGIHGEPGISDHAMPTATELAALLVDRLLAERPDHAGSRVVPILNGLGTITDEELFLLYARVEPLLTGAGLEVVEPECGRLVTSLDMSGLSLTLLWLDDELEALWSAPCWTAAYRKGTMTVPDAVAPTAPEQAEAQSDAPERPPATAASARLAATIVAALAAVDTALAEHESALGALDAVAGDGDHGAGMRRGASAALAAARSALDGHAGADTLLAEAGDAWSEQAGGTSGALWGAGLAAAGTAVGARERYERDALVAAVTAFRDEIQRLGKAEPGEKTMVDAVIPFATALQEAVDGGVPAAAAIGAAAAVARRAAEDTAAMRPTKGRARPLAERSVGHPDPGAVSFALIAETVARVTAGGDQQDEQSNGGRDEPAGDH